MPVPDLLPGLIRQEIIWRL